MSLERLLAIANETDQKKQGLSEQRILDQMDSIRHLIAYFREYPDKYIDFITKDDPECTFKFYFYQRIFIRVVMRHRYVYATFPRASKWRQEFFTVCGKFRTNFSNCGNAKFILL